MASSRLLLPSFAALFQSPPFSCSDKCHHGVPRSVPSPSLASQTPKHDSAPTARFSANGEVAWPLEGEVSSSEEELELREEGETEEEEEEEKEDKDDDGSASETDLRGIMSKFIWSRPRKRPPPVSLSREQRMMTVYSLLNNPSNLLVELDKARFLLTPSDFGRLLEQFILGKRWDKVGLLFDWMKVNKKLRAHSLSIYITLMGKAGLCYRAFRAYNGLTDKELKLNKYVANSLLKGLVDAGSLDKVFSLFEELKSDGFEPDVYSYSTVIAGCARRPRVHQKAKIFMDEMISRGLKPDAFVYSSMLNVYTRSGDESKAKELINEMRENGVKPASYHYAPFLNMYAEKKKLEEAEKLFEEFQEAGLALNEVMMNSLIKVYLSCGLLEKASKLFDDMPSLCCPPGEVTYSLMIDAHCKAGLLEKAQSLYEDMKRRGICPGNHVYSILISTYGRMGNVEFVLSLNKELESRKEGISDLVLFNSVLKSFCELSLMDAVMSTLKKMNKESITPDRATFNILICFFCKQGMLDIAIKTLNDLKARKFQPNVNSYGQLITELSNSGNVDEAVNLIAESREYSVYIPAVVYDAVIDALCREKRLDKVLAHFKTMADHGVSLSPRCLENILILAGKDRDVLRELLGYSSLDSKILTEVSLAMVLSAYEKEGFHASMHELLDHLKSKGVSVDRDEQCAELIHNLKQDAEMEILSKLDGRISKMHHSAASSPL